MTLVAIAAAILVALPAYLFGRHLAGRRYQILLSAAAEKHAHNLSGLSAVIENLRRDIAITKDPGILHRAIVFASAQLLLSAKDADQAGDFKAAQDRRDASAHLTALIDGVPHA